MGAEWKRSATGSPGIGSANAMPVKADSRRGTGTAAAAAGIGSANAMPVKVVTVVELDRGKFRLGFTADPKLVEIRREELVPTNDREPETSP